ncbi:RND family efflux transporter, MFP subunit [Rhizobium sp. RU35A]|uniref:Efflux RND transporter periplasmic adaptor subunit n=1 Tax=Rhizobium straminoryzae TaxID=1387186 RepID=A0A549TF44_9HYPH|nr:MULTISPECIES: efflux RND transporter periplasmic adaptor subunit [Rhizobium]TRL41152.1 efflux RND transporter periplasmic adaptor subunit [Rhizobium straminoryzae]SIQ44453.1 RND family efflux transporter, MFP subunit [Rhizobium sp. RU35A]
MKLLTVIPLVLLAAGLAACSEEKKAEAPVRPVLSMLAKPREATAFGFTGTVQPKFSTDLGFQVLGRIVQRSVNVGDLVKKGDVLARLDATSLELAVRQAEADLASARAKADLARVNEQRQQTLLASNATTKQQLEEAVQSREAADATVQQQQADLTKAKEQLGYATLEAESDGVVSTVSAEVGQVVTAGQTVLTIARLEARDAQVDIPDSYVQLTAIGTPFLVTLQANPEVKVTGTVREAAPQADAATRSRRTKIALDNPPQSYRFGSTVTATPVAPSEGHLWLPETAIGGEDGARFVWIVDPAAKTVQRRSVTIQPSAAGGVDVLTGLKDGERVVTAGVNSLTENQPVRLSGEIAP